MSGPLRILHVISGLGQGGAESVLARLAAYPDPDIRHCVVSLTDEGVYGAALRQAGVPVHALGMRPGRFLPRDLLALRRLIAARQPDVVQTWMYHADLVGGLAARWAGNDTVVWNIRNSGVHLHKSSISARIVLRLCAALSGRIPAAIVCCAEGASVRHRAAGYRADRMVVVPNGYDLARYSPDTAAGLRQRAAWGVPADTPLIGCVARWDPLKDHANLLHALALLRGGGDGNEGGDFIGSSGLRCVLVGRGMDAANGKLAALIRRFGLDDCIILAGPSNDVPAVMNALDVHVLASCAEAFPNVVVEAMACGTPCVVTDVGDAARIVGDTGWSVQAGQPDALARAMVAALRAVAARGRGATAEKGRLRAREFSLDRMARAYCQVWRRVVERTR